MTQRKKSLESNLISQKAIEKKIFLIRGKKVMLDRDLAKLYEVETKVFNQGSKKKHIALSFRFYVSANERRI